MTTPEKWTFKKMGSRMHSSSERMVSAKTVIGDMAEEGCSVLLMMMMVGKNNNAAEVKPGSCDLSLPRLLILIIISGRYIHRMSHVINSM